MKSSFLKPVLLNLSIAVLVFILFVFLDVNLTRASSSRMHGSQSIAPVKVINDRLEGPANPFFSSDPSSLIEQNHINTNTNALTLRIRGRNTQVMFFPSRSAYYRFEIPEFIYHSSVSPERVFVRILPGTNGFLTNGFIPSYLGPVNLLFRRHEGQYRACWISGPRPEPGIYQAVLYIDGQAAISRPFSLIARKPPVFTKTLSCMNLEENSPVTTRTVMDRNLNRTSFTNGLLDWMDYGSIDAFLTLAGETTGWGGVTPEKPWEYYPLRNLEILGPLLKARGKSVGAYIMCFYTPRYGWRNAGYSPALGVKSSKEGAGIFESEFVSIKDRKRFHDIAAMAARLDSDPTVDFIGFDFVRLGERAGLENAAEFTRQMNVAVPAGFDAYSGQQKIEWLGRALAASTDLVKKWRLWMAHTTADYIYRVRLSARLKKPVWVFTLGWDHGTDHGQDPYFFQDAGVFADFVMLYEASPDMFTAMERQWPAYLKEEKLNLCPGNQIDTVVNRSKSGRNAVQEYHYRLTAGASWSKAGPAGVFIHDFGRAFWGRRGSYRPDEWFSAAFTAVSDIRARKGEIPFSMKFGNGPITAAAGQKTAKVPLYIEIKPEFMAGLRGRTLTVTAGTKNEPQKIDISENSHIILYITVDIQAASSPFAAARGQIDGYPASFAFVYPNIQTIVNQEKPVS